MSAATLAGDNALAGVGGGELLGAHAAFEVGFEGLEELVGHFLLDALALLVDLVVGGDANLVGALDGDYRYGTAGEHLGYFLLKFNGVDGLVELDDIVAAAGEIDTLVEAAEAQRDSADEDEGGGDNEGALALGQEIDAAADKHLAAQCGAEGHLLHHLALGDGHEEQAAQVNCGEERADDTYDEGGSEALDGTCTEEQQDDAGDD